MSFLILPTSRNFQPNQAVKPAIDGISSGIVSLSYPSAYRDVVKNKPVVLSNNATFAYNPQGLAWRGASSDCPVSIGASGGLGTIVDLSKPWSLALRVRVSAIGSTQYFIGDADSSHNNKSFFGYISPSGYWNFTFYFNAGANVRSVSFATIADVGFHDVLIVSTGGNFIISVYIDGKLEETLSQAGNIQDSGTSFRLLQSGLYSTNSFSGEIDFCAFFQENKSAYARQLAANPWQLLQPIKRLLFVPASSGVTDLSGSAKGIAAATGTITSAISIVGATASITSATGNVSIGEFISGVAPGVTTDTGAITENLNLNGINASVSIANGIATVAISLSGDDVAKAAAQGNPTIALELSGAALSKALTDANISIAGEGSLSGSAKSSSQTIGSINVSENLGGNSASNSSASGITDIAIPFIGSARAYTSAIGGISTILNTSGVAASVSTTSGNLTVTAGITNLLGDIKAESLLGGAVNLLIPISGIALAKTLSFATLTLPGAYTLPSGKYAIRSLTPHYKIRSLTHAD